MVMRLLKKTSWKGICENGHISQWGHYVIDWRSSKLYVASYNCWCWFCLLSLDGVYDKFIFNLVYSYREMSIKNKGLSQSHLRMISAWSVASNQEMWSEAVLGGRIPDLSFVGEGGIGTGDNDRDKAPEAKAQCIWGAGVSRNEEQEVVETPQPSPNGGWTFLWIGDQGHVLRF